MRNALSLDAAFEEDVCGFLARKTGSPCCVTYECCFPETWSEGSTLRIMKTADGFEQSVSNNGSYPIAAAHVSDVVNDEHQVAPTRSWAQGGVRR